MKIKLTVTVLILATCGSVLGANPASAAASVVKIYDGDTITLSSGEKVRLLQIDTPELSPAECYGEEARNALISLLNQSGSLSFKEDLKLDKVDRYGRLLRYVFVGKTNINLKMVEIGAAAPYFTKEIGVSIHLRSLKPHRVRKLMGLDFGRNVLGLN
jgi:endonuclease YncB( thermonuclease family)